MVTCSLNALKKSSKRKEMRIKKENVDGLQQAYMQMYTVERGQERQRLR